MTRKKKNTITYSLCVTTGFVLFLFRRRLRPAKCRDKIRSKKDLNFSPFPSLLSSGQTTVLYCGVGIMHLEETAAQN